MDRLTAIRDGGGVNCSTSPKLYELQGNAVAAYGLDNSAPAGSRTTVKQKYSAGAPLASLYAIVSKRISCFRTALRWKMSFEPRRFCRIRYRDDMNNWWPCLFYCCLAADSASAVNLDNRDGVRATAIAAAAANARFAERFCGLPAAKLASYKSTVRVRMGELPDFESNWKDGWAREQGTIRGYEELRIENPPLFAANVNAACAEFSKTQQR